MKMGNKEYEVTHSSSGDEDLASERISRVNFFLLGANTKYGQAVTINIK